LAAVPRVISLPFSTPLQNLGSGCLARWPESDHGFEVFELRMDQINSYSRHCNAWNRLAER